jgi:hypothetical protein
MLADRADQRVEPLVTGEFRLVLQCCPPLDAGAEIEAVEKARQMKAKRTAALTM